MAGCFCFANPSSFLFGLSQKGTICSNSQLSTLKGVEGRAEALGWD